jgi:hypothetical protein
MISDTQQRTALVLPKHQDTAGGGLFGKGDALRCAARVVPSFSELVWERKQCAAGSAGCPHPANENRHLRSVVDAYSSPDEGSPSLRVATKAPGCDRRSGSNKSSEAEDNDLSLAIIPSSLSPNSCDL